MARMFKYRSVIASFTKVEVRYTFTLVLKLSKKTLGTVVTSFFCIIYCFLNFIKFMENKTTNKTTNKTKNFINKHKGYFYNFFWQLYKSLLLYPVFNNLNYWWNFGVLAFLCLLIQILSGIFLAMYYVANSEVAFISVEHIMRNVNYGWFVRYLHSNGASFFFLVVYLHMFRSFYYNSFLKPKEKVWATGVVILLLMIITAFLGYVLPWGQMSFWAATVITNLCSAIPVIGDSVVIWLWGGYAVDNATLNRFFSLHFVMPFLILIVVCLHVYFLHDKGSSNPSMLSVGESRSDKFLKTSFYPYFVIKDLVGIQIFLFFFLSTVFFFPNYLGHPDNYIPANPLVTPAHIVPEWYFLPFYAILRSIPNKLIGVLFLFFSIVILFILPWLTAPLLKNSVFNKYHVDIFWFFLGVCLLLGWIGGEPVEEPYLFVGRFMTFLYFCYLGCVINSTYRFFFSKNEI